MATYDLTNQPISSSFDTLLQIDSGSALRDGTGSIVDNIVVTSSYAVTASYAENVIDPTWDNIQDKPSGLVSGSSQIDLGLAQGTASFAVSASYAVSASVEIIKEISSSYADHTQWSGIYNVPDGLVSGSSQIVLEDVTYTDNGVDSFLTTDGAGNLSFDYVRSLYQNIRNMEATPILKGTPLFVSGATGDNANVYRADAGNPSRFPATLIAGDATLAPAAAGKGLISGKIENVNTNAYAPGTEVYLGVGGGWTATRPTGSASVQLLGVVTRQGNNGHGVFINQLQAHLPNLQSGYAWVGDGDGVPQAVATSSFAVSIDTGSLVTTSSFNEYTSSTDARLSSIELETSSLDTRVTSLENFSSSLDATFVNQTELADATSSLINSIATKLDTGSYLTDSSSFDTRIDSLETFSSSLDTNFVSETEFGVYTSSNDSKVTNLINKTGSYATTGSNNFIGNQDIEGSVSSTQNQSNTHYNPQIITDTVTIPTGQNGIIIGETSIAGNYTIEGNSEVYAFTEPDLAGYITSAQTGSFVKLTDANTFTDTQKIVSSTTKNLFEIEANGVTIVKIDPSQALANKVNQFADSIYLYQEGATGPQLLISSSAGTNQIKQDGMFFNNSAYSNAFARSNLLAPNYNHSLYFGLSNDMQGVLFNLPSDRVGFFFGEIGPGPYPQFYLDINTQEFTVNSNFNVTGSVNITDTINLSPQDPLPTGSVGDLATSGSNLYFHDGTNWRTVNFNII